jgi:hypothetical protein
MPAYECAYCGVLADATDDHIPPKSFFSGELDAPLPSVKACAACNGGSSKDDEYLRDTIVKYHRVGDLPHAQQLLKKVLRGLSNPKKAAYARYTHDSIVEMDVATPAGLVVGRHPAYRVDRVRLERVAGRYARGLHRYEFGERVAESTPIRVVCNPDEVNELAAEFTAGFLGAEVRLIQKHVFWYAVKRPTDRPDVSYWLLMFFDVFPIVAAIRPAPP